MKASWQSYQGTSGRGGDEILRTVRRLKRSKDTSETIPRYSSYPWRSWGDICKRRNTQKNTGRDPSWRQGDGDRGRWNARDSSKMEWSSRSDDGRQGCSASYWAAVKQKIDELARGRRKWRKEDDIRPEKHAYSPTVSRDIFNYYSIIVELNLEFWGFTKFRKSFLLLHDYHDYCQHPWIKVWLLPTPLNERISIVYFLRP